MRGAQEAMRLSAGQMSKLQNEYKLVCKENQELKQIVSQLGDQALPEYQERVNVLSGEIQRLNEVVAQKHVDVGEVSKQLHNKNKKLEEISVMTKTIGSLQEKIGRLVNENESMDNDMKGAQ